jgi:hypothetical protein
VDAADALPFVAVGLGIAIPLITRGAERFREAPWIVLALCGAVLLFDLIVVSTDLGDADGFVDCSSYCSTWQSSVVWTGTLSVALALGLALGLIARSAPARSRAMRK